MNNNDKNRANASMSVFARLMSFSKPYWGRIVIAALGSLAVGGLDGAFAWLVEPLLRKIFSQKDLVVFSLLPLAIIVIFIIRGACRYLNDYFVRTVAHLGMRDIRNAFYQRAARLGLRFYSDQSTGGLMSRALNDVNTMQDSVAGTVTSLFRDGFGVIVLLGVVFYRNWQLALIAFTVIPLTVWPAQKLGKKIKTLTRQSQGQMGDISAILQETFSGIKVIKAFNLEDRETGRFIASNQEFYNFIRRSIKYEALAAPITELLTSFGIAGVVWYGGMLVMRGAMSPSEFFSFITAMALLYGPVKKLTNTYNAVQRSLGAAERVFEILDMQPEISDRPDAISLPRATGRVEFRNVSFSYGAEPVLSNISLSAERNEIIALVGPSGSGKSTMVSLIPRFYESSEGTVLIDGHDVRSLTLSSLVEQIALVDQETTLFNETIANNIRYGKPDASDEEVINAAQAAYAHDFIMGLPDGYGTEIGDRGVRLSGGQRQRLCIARALIKNAPILILDEATSALDTESELMVQKALDNLMANRTTFVIAHRLSTVLHADKIIVLENGQIIESGRHEDLVQKNGLYQRLYMLQFKDSEPTGEGQ